MENFMINLVNKIIKNIQVSYLQYVHESLTWIIIYIMFCNSLGSRVVKLR